MMPLLSSLVINAGNRTANSGETDQRGRLRAGNGLVDVGAVEVMWNCVTRITNGTTYYYEDSSPVQAAANASASGGAIRLAGNCVGTQTRNSRVQLLDIDKNLTLEGGWNTAFTSLNPASPTVLDAANTGRVLYVANNLSVTLAHLNLTRGNSSNGGGAYFGTGTTITLHNAHFYGNATSTDGGGIYFLGATLTLNGSSVYANTATAAGGGIYANGNTLTLNQSNVNDNVAAGNGGGIYAARGAINLTSSKVNSNSSTSGEGGGIFGVNNPGLGTVANIALSQSVIASNSARAGGGIRGGGTLNISNSSILSNAATNGNGGGIATEGNLTVTQSKVNANSASGFGGGIAGLGMTLTQSEVISNTAAFGGGIYGTNIALTQSQLSSNRALTGGGLWATGNLSINQSSVVATNSATSGNGGGIRADAGSHTIVNSSILSNEASSGSGGGIWTSGNLAVTGSRVASNTATGNSGGGGIFGVNVTLTESELSSNTAPNGGGIRVTGNLTINQLSTVSNNKANNGDGGGILTGAGTHTFADSMIASNEASNNGGGLYADGTFILTSVTMEDNKAGFDGGSILIPTTGVGGGAVTSFRGNTARWGASIYNWGVFSITTSIVESNIAQEGGGGILNRGQLTITNSSITKNGTVAGGPGLGGGIANWSDQNKVLPVELSLVNSTVGENTATTGGGIYNTGKIDARFATIYKNVAANGLNIYNQPESGQSLALFATIVAKPPSENRAICYGQGVIDNGSNLFGDPSCGHAASSNIQLRDLTYPSSGTPYYMPIAVNTNEILDRVEVPVCETQLGAGNLRDQRGRQRPLRFETNALNCDIGAVEYGQELYYVCGAPLDQNNFPNRCQYDTIASALDAAATEDTIIVSGVITESVTVAKSVTIRGPSLSEITPGTHMGFVQASRTIPADGCDTNIGSVFKVVANAAVEMRDLNIRNGCAVNGGGINVAAGSQLTLHGVTIYNSRATDGGAIYNSGLLSVTNSTLISVTSGLHNHSSGQAWLQSITLQPTEGSAIQNASANTVSVAGSIISGIALLCSGPIADGGNNLVADGSCSGVQPVAADDPQLGPLRDNGGPTLTRAILSPDSPAVTSGPTSCPVSVDQRGKQRPLNREGDVVGRCDIGALEYGPQTLTVCANCSADPAVLRFDNLQEALNRAMAGDTLAIAPGVYTGNFVVYRDLVLQHAGIDVSSLDAAQGIDARAILQASSDPILEQRKGLNSTQSIGLVGRVLTVQSYLPDALTIAPAEDVVVTLRDLTLRHGMSRQGGAIFNRGNLRLERSTLHDNASVNQYTVANVLSENDIALKAQGGAIYNSGALVIERSTLSANQSEFYGGAIYNDTVGTVESLRIVASTLVDNRAAPLPTQHTVRWTNTGEFDPPFITLRSGDWARFENAQGSPRTLTINPEATVVCDVQSLALPAMGMGLSQPLRCTLNSGVSGTVDVSDISGRTLTITVNRVPFEPKATTIYRENGRTRIARTVLLGSSGNACDKATTVTTIEDGGYNLFNDNSCVVSGQVEANARNFLGALQDNNQIDFEKSWISGFVHTHALLPDSRAVNQIPVEICAPGTISRTLAIPATATITAGDIIVWQNSTATPVTLALDDGDVGVRLITIAGNRRSAPIQLAATTAYRAYNSAGVELGIGQITVVPRTGPLSTDQRGLSLPLRGVQPLADDTSVFHCDIGAYEFQPWIVGQSLPRPPAAVGDPPLWQTTNGAKLNGYNAWSLGTRQDFATRPSFDTSATDNQLPEQIRVVWDRNPDLSQVEELPQIGLAIWPENPQIHIAGAPVNLEHSAIADGFLVSTAAAFEGTAPPPNNEAGVILSGGVFMRTLLALPGDSYSVLQYSASSGAPALKIQVVKSVNWQDAGVRDFRVPTAQVEPCIIGKELTYRFATAADQQVTHVDPEGKAGYILGGSAYDGVVSAADLTLLLNTVNGLLPPAHVRESRDGPIIPVLEQTPGVARTAAGHDLEVAWYRADSRNVAWPVKSAGYICNWPQTPPRIVIASELGSEIGGQPVLLPARYVNAAIYHQTDPTQPGYSPNWEHALLAASNTGQPAPALYALRTDLRDRIASTAAITESYTLLKYRDSAQNNRIQMAVYRVALTEDAETIPAADLTLRATGNLPADGRVTLPVEALGARNLSRAIVRIPYDPASVTPIGCAVNRQKFIEAPIGLIVESDQNLRPGRSVRLRAILDAGTDVQYLWDFGDGTARIAGTQVSTVYPADGVYTVAVTASNGAFAAISAVTNVVVDTTAAPQLLGAAPTASGCYIEGNEIVLNLAARNKHGESGNLTLADITFQSRGFAGALNPPITATELLGPDYSQFSYNMTAGNPLFAPVPLRNLLDVQPCAETAPYEPEAAKPFWKDFKDTLWARAAGEMQVLYFYPLQPGFYLSDPDARELGLFGADRNLLPEAARVGRCVPWLHKEAASTRYEGFPQPVDATEKLPGMSQVLSTTHVLSVTYNVSWPALAPTLTVGETVYQRPKSGISGVAEQLAVARIYDDLAPGEWDNDAASIILTGTEVMTSLAQLIDPVGELRVELPIVTGDGNPGLPENIKSERLLFGGGRAILGTTDNAITLPFSLRSRILFDEASGELIFRGYYDGASKEYIKGDPLLLLNVMSDADQSRLLELCPTGKADCDTWGEAIKSLYWQSHNPRQVDLCRDSAGRLDDLDPDPIPAENRGAQDATKSATCPAGSYRDGQADHAFLIGVQDEDDDGIPEPYAGLGKGKALSAGNAAGTGYITLAYNNDASLGSLPVSLQVIQVGCTLNDLGEDSTYRGNLLVIKSDNLFDEKLTLRHTGDFGGRPDNFDFEWYIAPVDDTGVSPSTPPPTYPWQSWTKIEPGMDALGPEITIEGANPTTLSDNWLIMRYKGYAACGNTLRYSAWAGDPAAKPSELRGQLAEGWIKRVTNALNPFDARVRDFVSSPVNTTVDMVSQAGKRYEGPIALSNDPETLNRIGLIEAYQTVLERGKILSIDNGVNDQGANAALLNVTTRIAELYMLLANDAYADALDPTVAIGTDSALGSRAPTLFAFMNQFRADIFGLLDEELALLRGRDETLGGVAAAPTYNRLTWNFTNGPGEVAYVQNYNIKDFNEDGFVDEVDGSILYPQGHGDAWGHFLTSLGSYYQLLRHPNYTWIPRAEPVAVAGVPVVVDYYDERRFALAAAGKAQIGKEIVDLTYRKHYAEPQTQPWVDPQIDPSDGTRRAWGVDDWARRAGQGAYIDWVVANAILPPEEIRYGDLRKIDRTTVFEIGQIAEEFAAIQAEIDDADSGLNPLGLAGNAVLFDLDPSLTQTGLGGQTHFEQIYDKALASLGTTVTLFDYANEMKAAQRESQNNQRTFIQSIVDQDRALMNELMEIFGAPYAADVGVNGTYPAGYTGPDFINYDLIDRSELTDPEQRCSDQQIKNNKCVSERVINIQTYLPGSCTQSSFAYSCPTLEIVKPITLTIGLDGGIARYKPKAWPAGDVRAPVGEIQVKMWGVYDAKIEYEMSLLAYQNHVKQIEDAIATIKERAEYLAKVGTISNATRWTVYGLNAAAMGFRLAILGIQQGSKSARDNFNSAQTCLPLVVGMATDATSLARCSLLFSSAAIDGILGASEIGLTVAGEVAEFGAITAEAAKETVLFDLESDYELKQMGREVSALLRQESELRLAVFLAADNYAGAQDDYLRTIALGFRKLQELQRLRQRWAGQISEQRYGDMTYRIFQIDALQKYRRQFDLAQQYVYLTAAAYDYETNLASDDPAGGSRFLRQIVAQRSLGELRQRLDFTVIPIAGSGGLADPLARMSANFQVLKGQMGFNNPQSQAARFSLRHELLRLRDDSDAKWRQSLMRYYTPDIFAHADVGRLAKRPYGATGPQPGFVIPFGSTVSQGLNFFGLPLGPGDGAYNATQFSTKISSVGVWFDGYDTERLARMPYVYLLPAGNDVIRPRNTQGKLRYWNVAEQQLPLPYPITESEVQKPTWIPRVDGLQGQMFQTKPYASFQAFPYSEEIDPSEINTDSRLIGRSVWNTKWVLVIPGSALMADPEQGLARFAEDVDDIYIYFRTYSYAGTVRSAEEEESRD